MKNKVLFLSFTVFFLSAQETQPYTLNDYPKNKYTESVAFIELTYLGVIGFLAVIAKYTVFNK